MPYPNQTKQINPDNPDVAAYQAQIQAPGAPTAPQVTAATGGAPQINTGTQTGEVGFREGIMRDMTGKIEDQSAYRPRPWGETRTVAPTQKTLIENPNDKWTLQDIKQNNEQMVNTMKEALWQRYQQASDSERQSAFFQGVKQNPTLAAASMVRRALHNMSRTAEWINGEKTPTLDQAARDTLQNNELRKWMQWTRSGGRMPR